MPVRVGFSNILDPLVEVTLALVLQYLLSGRIPQFQGGVQKNQSLGPLGVAVGC